MAARYDRATILRWIFLSAGVFLLLGGSVLLGFHTFIHQAGLIFVADAAERRKLVAVASVLPWATSTLCLLTWRGIGLGRSWARWTGTWASFLLIGLFSPISLLGFGCLWALAKPLPPQPIDNTQQ
jgi:hypothetical protein